MAVSVKPQRELSHDGGGKFFRLTALTIPRHLFVDVLVLGVLGKHKIKTLNSIAKPSD